MLRTPAFCYPIITSSLITARLQIEKEAPRYDAFEVWVDYLEDFSLDELQELALKLGDKLIVVLRRKGLEPPRLSIEARKALLTLLADTAAYVDLDLNNQLGELAFFEKLPRRPKLVLSVHHYDETPLDSELRRTIKKMERYDPSVYMIAAMCRVPDDALRLLRFGLHLRTAGKRCIVLGMGMHGAVTRIFGTLWSNELIFAPPQLSASSAPGQLSRGALETIFTIVKEECGG